LDSSVHSSTHALFVRERGLHREHSIGNRNVLEDDGLTNKDCPCCSYMNRLGAAPGIHPYGDDTLQSCQ
jgi:hypothetical protein